MSAAADREVEERLRAAWKREECLFSVTNRGRKLLLARLRRGDLVSPYPELYDSPGHWDSLTASQRHLHVLRALSRIRPGWVFCERSAAVAHGLLSLGPGVELAPQVVLPPRSHSRSPSSAAWLRCEGAVATEAAGVPVTDVARTAFDCLRRLPFYEAMPVADAAAAHMGGGAAELARALCSYRGRGAVTARHRALLADPRCENGGESMLRARIIALGFEPPMMQVRLADPLRPGVSYRPDCLWLPAGVSREQVERAAASGGLTPGSLAGGIAGELDGWEKYVSPHMAANGFDKAVLDERRRESRLTLLGLRFVRFSYAEACSDVYVEKMLLAAGVPRLGPPLVNP